MYENKLKKYKSKHALASGEKDVSVNVKSLKVSYLDHVEKKYAKVQKLLKPYGKVDIIHTMSEPYHYRNKVSAAFGYRKGKIIAGTYEEGTHRIIDGVSEIEDALAGEIITTIKGLCHSFKLKTYDEDLKTGFLRHVLIRVGKGTGEVMVVLVTGSLIFPGKNHFIKALKTAYPAITTIVQNINDKSTSMVLGEREIVLFGKGYITDILCGMHFRISPKSFYQVNPVQTEKLYQKAIEYADFKGNEQVLDAYCGIGTIGMVASRYAMHVIGVENNADAIKDARNNAKLNQVKDIDFICADASAYMQQVAASKEKRFDVILMDPPRAGATVEFIKAVGKIAPKKVVYISCNPETLARDLGEFKKCGYQMEKGEAVDMFPWTEHVETVALMSIVKD